MHFGTTFWVDAVKYASSKLKSSPHIASGERASRLEVLTRTAPELRFILVFDFTYDVRLITYIDFLHVRKTVTIVGHK